MTTIELGGAARYLVDAEDDVGVEDVVRWASRYGFELTVLGGGSNVVISDRGVQGLALRMCIPGIHILRDGDAVRLSAGAGEPWDGVVARAVEEDLAGLECMSGIPGTAGATPIQNVGAYGQEVSDVVEEVEVFDRGSLKKTVLSASDCRFGYRTSMLREDPDRFIVLRVVFRLQPAGPPTLGYPELARALETAESVPTLADARAAVLELRRSKSMCIERTDRNRRSVGSFFVNPVVDDGALPGVAEAAAVGCGDVPTFAAEGERIKIPAAWLIQHAGFPKGYRRGRVGISSRHNLALVHLGGGSTDDLVALAREIRSAVRDLFGIDLKPEPRFLGFDAADPTAGD
jgi:UDP-N-acetylmuramate dehydrogenase